MSRKVSVIRFEAPLSILIRIPLLLLKVFITSKRSASFSRTLSIPLETDTSSFSLIFVSGEDNVSASLRCTVVETISVACLGIEGTAFGFPAPESVSEEVKDNTVSGRSFEESGASEARLEETNKTAKPSSWISDPGIPNVSPSTAQKIM